MARKKRTSRVLEKAQLRSAGLKAIDPKLDFGNNHNLNNLTQLIEQLRSKIDAYNTALSVIDSSQAQIEQLEKSLSNLSETMLLGVGFKYGKDSYEYEMAGGVRTSERTRRIRAGRLRTNAQGLSSDNNQTA